MDADHEHSGWVPSPPKKRGTRNPTALVSRVAQTVAAHHMLADGDRVLIAVSGGPDSVALWRAVQVMATRKRLTLAMVHVNYHLRGEESDEDEFFCRQLAAQSGASIYVRSRRRPRSTKTSFNLQDWARRKRYEVFAAIAEQENFRRIAVGHQYDDQVETIVSGLVGGRGSFALTGIPRVRGRIIRPLFDCRRAEILEFLQHIGQSYREDRSNRESRYLRNRVRNEILPQLRKEAGPRLDTILFRWADVAAEQEAVLCGIVERWLMRSVVDSGNGWLSLDLRKVRRLDHRLDFTLLRQVLCRSGRAASLPGEQIVQRFRELVNSGRAGSKLVWGNAVVEASRDMVTFYSRRPMEPEPVEVAAKGTTCAEGWSIRVTCRCRARRAGQRVRLPRGAWRFYGDADAIHFPLVLRGPRLGERIQPLGMVGRRKIVDILAEAGVPALLRPHAPVLADRCGVIWIVGRHQDDRVNVTPHTRQLVSIQVERLPGRDE